MEKNKKEKNFQDYFESIDDSEINNEQLEGKNFEHYLSIVEYKFVSSGIPTAAKPIGGSGGDKGSGSFKPAEFKMKLTDEQKKDLLAGRSITASKYHIIKQANGTYLATNDTIKVTMKLNGDFLEEINREKR